MKFSQEHIDILQKILEEKCIDDKIITRAEVFEEFELHNKSGMEKYYFEKELSNLIKTNQITGFEIKVGRNGGVVKQENIEVITVTCSFGRYTGKVRAKAIVDFLNKNHLENTNTQSIFKRGPVILLNKAFDVLLEHSQVKEKDRALFIKRLHEENEINGSATWLFQGDLGLGGMFYYLKDDTMYVACYPEDHDRCCDLIDKINTELNRLLK